MPLTKQKCAIPDKIDELEAVARHLVGDGKRPNLFFVSAQPMGLILVTRGFHTAHLIWRQLPKNIETCLEDRLFGTICSNEPEEDDSLKLISLDSSATFLEMWGLDEPGKIR